MLGIESCLTSVAEDIMHCAKCPLSKGRIHTVPGDGSSRAKVMLIGEAPGRNEDRLGKSFTGVAGRFLDELLAAAMLKRKDIYITNIVKCRPQKNRKPKREEIDACSPYLEKQIYLINPRYICPMGAVALEALFKIGIIPDPSGQVGERKIPEKRCELSQLHGKTLNRDRLKIIPLYHPAAAIYNRKLQVVMLEDMKRLGKTIRCKKIPA